MKYDQSWRNKYKSCRWSDLEDRRLLEWVKEENKANGVVISSVHPTRNMKWEEISMALRRSTKESKTEFRYFRDKYLKQFKNFKARAVDGTRITWDLWNDHFIEYYNQVILHISNE